MTVCDQIRIVTRQLVWLDTLLEWNMVIFLYDILGPSNGTLASYLDCAKTGKPNYGFYWAGKFCKSCIKRACCRFSTEWRFPPLGSTALSHKKALKVHLFCSRQIAWEVKGFFCCREERDGKVTNVSILPQGCILSCKRATCNHKYQWSQSLKVCWVTSVQICIPCNCGAVN